ncbi:MAG TPA: hypothetical protein VK659_02590 [Asanoa sp.]|nr:hypothetical protein [Asanoa sp.]
MSFWEAVSLIGPPLVLVAGAAGLVWSAFSDRPDTFSRPRGWQWGWVGLWLMAAGDAAVGDNRWWFERAWKGCAALLVAAAVAVGAWRHYRWRRRVRLVHGSPEAAAAPNQEGRPA